MNTLENLTDSEIRDLSQWYDTLTVREKDALQNSYSTKFSYHVIRLLLQAEQILIEHDLDIERNAEILKSVRRGEWSLERVLEWFGDKEKQLEELYVKSTLQHKPDEEAIKDLLLTCLEQHYGSLGNAVKRNEVPVEKMIAELKKVIEKYE